MLLAALPCQSTVHVFSFPPAQDQVLATVDGEAAVPALLWAQRFVDAGNGAFGGLLAGLKAWVAAHEAQVVLG
jgi:hypothetical protein